MSTYAWRFIDDSGNAIPEQIWNTPSLWVAYPASNPPVTGVVPGATDLAYVGAGNANVSSFGFVHSYPVTVDVTDSRSVATLGLGGMSITNVSIGASITPIFGPSSIFPTIKVNGGSLDVTGDIVDTFTGTIDVPLPIFGPTIFTGTFQGGGLIDIGNKGVVEAGGAVAAGITVAFTDGLSDVLKLDDVTAATPKTFAGTVEGFAIGDTILLSKLTALHTVTDTYSSGVLNIVDSVLGTVASLGVAGAFTANSFQLTEGTGGLSVTLPGTAAPPSAPVLDAASDSGVKGDKITNVVTPIFDGTSAANAVVTLHDGSMIIGTGTATAAGTWSIASSVALANGIHSITATDSVASGPSSAPSAALSVTIDTQAPAAPSAPVLTDGIGNTDTIANTTALVLTGTAEAGSVVDLLDTGKVIGVGSAAAVTGAWTITVNPTLAAGNQTITATAMDAAGNTGVASTAVVVDIVAPSVTPAPGMPALLAASDSGAKGDGLTNVPTPTFTGTGVANDIVTLHSNGSALGIGTGTVTAGGTWSIALGTALADGKYAITATEAPAGGAASVASSAFALTIDTKAPAAPSAPVLTDGILHTDTIASTTALTLTGTAEAGSTVELLDAGKVIGTGSAAAITGAWSITVSPTLTLGNQTITAIAMDGAGNTGVASAPVVVDIVASAVTPPPSAPVLLAASDSGAKGDGLTNVATPTFTGIGVANDIVTLHDNGSALGIGTGTVTAGGTWSITFGTALSDGLHAISATEAPAGGTASAASAAFGLTIDTHAPAAPSAPVLTDGLGKSDTIVNTTALILTGTAEAGSVVDLLDAGKVIGTGAAAAVTGAWSITVAPTLALGIQTITATATDAAGNTSVASAPVAIDIVTLPGPHDVHWIKGSGDFAVATNWSPARVPLPADNAIIDATGNYIVGSAANETVSTLAMLANSTLSISAGTFAITAGSGALGMAGIVNIGEGAILSLAGAVNNSGRINDAAVTAPSEILVNAAKVMLGGGGQVNLLNNASNDIIGAAPGDTLVNVNDVIAGEGLIGAGSMVLVNYANGIINANQTASLSLNTGAAVIVNQGLLESSNSGGLQLLSMVNNVAGIIAANGAAAVVDLSNVVIGGDLITSLGTILAVGTYGTLDGRGLHPVMSSGNLLIPDAASLTLQGSIRNTGSIVLASTTDTTSLLIGSPVVTLTGGGKVILGNAASNLIQGTAPGYSLVNVDNTISGAGALGGGQMGLSNAAVINANQVKALVVNTGVSILRNSGMLEATGTGGLVLQSDVVNNVGGTVQAVGAGSHVDLAASTIMGGTLTTSKGGVIDTTGGGTLDGFWDGALVTSGTVLLNDGESLALLGTIVNSGTIGLGAVASSAQIRLASPVVTLTGGGALILSNSLNNDIVGNAGTDRLVNNETISGAGQIGAGQMRLTNTGVINANQAPTSPTNAGVLYLNTAGYAVLNTGLLEATNTGGLVIQSSVSNAGGTIRAVGTGAHVDLSNNAIVSGGSIFSSAGGVIQTGAGSTDSLDGLTAGAINLSGSMAVTDGSSLYLSGVINNAGTIAVNAFAGTSQLLLSGKTVTLQGKGHVLLANSINSEIYGGSSHTTLLNVDNTIAGAGQIGVGGPVSLTNEAAGIIDATAKTALIINTTGNVINLGLMEATSTVSGNGGLLFQSTGVYNTGGTILATGLGAHVDLSNATIVGGTLASMAGGVVQDLSGSALDGSSAGAISLIGTVEVIDGATLSLQGAISNTGTIGENAVSGTSQLLVSGTTVTLSGKGSVLLTNSVNNQIYAGSSHTTLVNVDNTIAGAGQIGAGGPISLTNEAAGVINATQKSALIINSTGTVVNAGLIEATNTVSGNSGLVIQSTFIDNTGGAIRATGAGAHVALSGATITGGTILATGVGAHVDLSSATIAGATLSSAAGAVIEDVASSYLDGSSAGAMTLIGTVAVVDGASLGLQGSINNTGTIIVTAVAGTSQIDINAPGVTLAGKGVVLLSNSPNNYIIGSGPPATLINVDNTISGAGQIGGGSMSLSNLTQGVIDATQKTALLLNSGGVDFSNQGLIEATSTVTGNGGLQVLSTTLQNGGGIIEASGANAHVDLNASTIIGGTLTTASGGVVNIVGGSVLDGQDAGPLVTSGFVRIADNDTLQLSGTIRNTGTLALQAVTSGAGLQLASPTVTLTGGGVVSLSNNLGNVISGAAGSDTLVNVDNTIVGAGRFGAGLMALSNSGTVNANAVNALTVDTYGQALINNAGGLLEGTGAGGLLLANGIVTNNGTVLAGDGSRVTYQGGVSNVNNAAGVLIGGAWEALSSGKGATVSVTGGAVSTDDAAIVLSGTNSVFRAGDGTTFVNLESSLTSIVAGGTLAVLGGRNYATNLGLTDNGVLQVGGGTLAANGLTIGAGGRLVGAGSVTSKTVGVTGTIEAAGGTMLLTGTISGTGLLQADAGGSMTLSAPGSSVGAVTGAGTISLSAGAGLDITASIDPASSDVFQLNTGSVLRVAADLGHSDRMSFLGASELSIDHAASFGLGVGTSYTGPLLQHFGLGDQVLLSEFTDTGIILDYNATTGLLLVNQGAAATTVASLSFDNASLGSGAFQVGHDNSGHLLITHS